MADDTQPTGEASFQPDPTFVLETLQQELNAANANRIYLMACLRQMQQEFHDAQEMWVIERESLMKGRDPAAGETAE